jgi:ABC-type glycerol-3-phosphate transport system permease component
VHPAFLAAGLAVALFVGVLLCSELGYRWGTAQLRSQGPKAFAGASHIEGAIFALLGLLLAFNFAGAAGRLERRHAQLIEEANAVGTAWLRLDLLPPESQPAIRDLFRRYVDNRMAVFSNLNDGAKRDAELARTPVLQGQIWALAVEANRDGTPGYGRLTTLPALNEMFDAATTRTRTALVHTSPVITGFVVCVALLSAAVAGYAMSESGRRPISHAVVFALIVSSTMYMIIDLDYPRFGLIRIDAADTVFRDLRLGMGR